MLERAELRKSLVQKRLRRSAVVSFDTAHFDEAIYAQEIAQGRRDQLRFSGIIKAASKVPSSPKA